MPEFKWSSAIKPMYLPPPVFCLLLDADTQPLSFTPEYDNIFVLCDH
jgi:hypothetical protein